MRTLLIAIFATVFLSGCPQTWHLTITDSSDLAHPHICLSSRRNCSGRPISTGLFVFAAVDEEGRYTDENGIVEPMWVIQPVENVPLGEFVYGIPPEGWEELQESRPFALDTWYVADQHYIRFTKSDSGIRSEVLTHEQYWTRKHRGG
jgi:hypothetical protein